MSNQREDREWSLPQGLGFWVKWKSGFKAAVPCVRVDMLQIESMKSAEFTQDKKKNITTTCILEQYNYYG